MTNEDILALVEIEAENSRAAKLLAEKDAQIEAQKIALLNAWDYCESLRKDAERYRWLRNNPQWLGWDHDFRPDEVEREIDAAMVAVPAVGDA